MRQFASEQVSVEVETDFTLLTQECLLVIALRNVVGNAVKYSQGKPVSICVRRGTVEVSDHGIGIPSENLPHIFEPFYRAGNTTGAQGHGIGLALAQAITHRLGGRLTASSTADSGTVFAFTWPLSMTL